MPRAKNPKDAVLLELRAFGLAYPGAHTKSPWPGHLDLAVKDKTFAYLSLPGQPLGISCKLPQSNAIALGLPFTKPAEYGLGKSGWVAASFPPGQKVPIELLKAWIDESYRAQAPKKLIAELDARGGGAPRVAPKQAKSRKPSPAAAASDGRAARTTPARKRTRSR